MVLKAAGILVLYLVAAFAEDASERFHQSIRKNDLAVLKTLVKEHGANVKDSRGQTPLMIAAAFGSVDAMKLLIDAGANVKDASQFGVTALHWCAGDVKKVRLLVDRGADVNARSQMGRTPLLVAAYTNGASETVKLLASKGADVNTADTIGVTPLLAAANVNDTATAKLLIAQGANVSARANIGQAATALMAAGHNGNLELTRLFLAHKAELNATSAPSGGITKNGPVQFGSVTALHLAALGGNAEVVKVLLGAGARVDVQDVRGMTPLMWAVSTDHPNVPIVGMLLQKGSDANFRSKADESLFDWARKFNHAAILEELKVPGAGNAAAKLSMNDVKTARAAVERSMPLLQISAARMLTDGGCIACHAQPVTAMAVRLARARGWKVDESAAAESLHAVKTRWMSAEQSLLQATDGGGSPDTMVYTAMMLAAAQEPPSWATDVLVHYLIAKQRADGNWHGVGASRAPIQDGDFSRTAMSVRALAAYGMPGRKAEIDERIARAARWLAAQTPLTTEDRVMQLLGLQWANANTRLRETRTGELIAQQRSDGGWAQTPSLVSDAYATGQVLYALHRLGVAPTDRTFRLGAEYLMGTQKEDGSWYVKSRAMKIQPYFESGFPYGHDQWISAAATAWAAMALSLTEPAENVAGK